MSRAHVAAWSAVALLALAGLAACSSSSSATAKAGTCLQPLSAPASAVASDPTPSAASDGPSLPSITFACLNGSGNVRLSSVGRPMIVSMWATWCQPCRAEVPQIQAFSQAANNAVAVVGVDTGDTHGAGASFVSDFKLTYPMVSDPATKLLNTVPPHELPTLLFVNGAGRIAYALASNHVDVATLRQLTAKYLGVTVA
jgi:cytochrome c biogenesis protein CcmG, thiol:disulfide interchange protein DsbE